MIFFLWPTFFCQRAVTFFLGLKMSEKSWRLSNYPICQQKSILFRIRCHSFGHAFFLVWQVKTHLSSVTRHKVEKKNPITLRLFVSQNKKTGLELTGESLIPHGIPYFCHQKNLPGTKKFNLEKLAVFFTGTISNCILSCVLTLFHCIKIFPIPSG